MSNAVGELALGFETLEVVEAHRGAILVIPITLWAHHADYSLSLTVSMASVQPFREPTMFCVYDPQDKRVRRSDVVSIWAVVAIVAMMVAVWSVL